MTAECQILARTIYGEARGEYKHPRGGLSSLIAVANVVMNRLKQNTWYGQTIQEVCQKPWQFSCWNENDPNNCLLKPEIIMDPLFSICEEVAIKVLTGQWPDLTGGCDHYHACYLKTKPRWTRGVMVKHQIGQHLFYNLNRRQ